MRKHNWIDDWAGEVFSRGDGERQRLCRTFFEAMSLTSSNAEASLVLFERARVLALQLDEAWWALLCTHWKFQILQWHRGDYKAALDLAVRATVEARKSIYARSPDVVSIHLDLVCVCVWIDACGHQARIDDALTFLDKEPIVDEVTRCVLQETHCEFAFEKLLACAGSWQESQADALLCLSTAQQAQDEWTRNHHSAYAFLLLCRVAHQRQDCNDLIEYSKDLNEYSKSGEECARFTQHSLQLCELLMWRALSERHLKQESDATRHYRSALQIASSSGATPWPGYFDAACAFHEAKGDLELALQMRESQLESLQDKGQNALEARGHEHRCHLLGELGRLTSTDLETARTVAQRLIEPQRALQKLQQLRIEYSIGE